MSFSQRKFTPQNATHLAKLKRLGELYVSPNSEEARQPSQHLRLVSNEVARATKVSIFRSPTSWLSSSELSLRFLEYLATIYPDLFRCVVHCFSTHPFNTVPFATVAHMLSKTVLDLFAPLPASSQAQPPPSPSPSGNSSQTNSTTTSAFNSNSSSTGGSGLFGSQTFLAPSALHPHRDANLTSSNGLSGLSLSNLHHIPILPADKGSTAVHLFDGKLPDASLLLFDSPHAVEEVFCWAMYIFFYLIVEKAQVLQITRMTSILAKVTHRLKKLLSKSSKLPDFIAYAMKAVKPTPASDNPEECGPLAAGNIAQKTALLNRIISPPYDEDGHEAIVSITILLDEEDRLGLGLGNSIENYTPTVQATIRSVEPKSSDPSPPRSKVTRKHTESPSKRKKSTELTEQKFGFVFLRAHLASLINALYSANKYENKSFGVPHLRGSRIFVNSLVKLIWAYVTKVPRGALDLDSAIKLLHKGGLTRSPLEPLAEYLTYENSTVARCALDIILKCITAFGEQQSYQSDLKMSFGDTNMSFSSSSVPPPPIVSSVESHVSPTMKHKKSAEKELLIAKKESGEARKESDSSSSSSSKKDSSSSDSSKKSKDSPPKDPSGSPTKSSKKERSPPKKSSSSPTSRSPTRSPTRSPSRSPREKRLLGEEGLSSDEGSSKERGRGRSALTSSDEAPGTPAFETVILVQKSATPDRAGRRSPERRRVVEEPRRTDSGNTRNSPPPGSQLRERSSSREFVSGSSPTRHRKKRNQSSKDSASSPPATALRSSDSITRSDSSSSVSSTSSSRSSSRSSFSSIHNYWAQYTATSIYQFEKLLDCDIVAAAYPHFAVLTRNVLPLALTLQSFVMSRVEEFTNAFLVLNGSDGLLKKDSTNDLTRSDSSQRSDGLESSISASGTGNGIAKAQTTRSLLRIFNNFWNKFMGDGCIALSGIVSKQWLLLGFEDEDPTKTIKNQWPIRVLRFLSENISPPERFDDLVMPRLMRKTEDYDIAIVFIELCQLVVTVTKDAIGETKNALLPCLFSHSYALEYLSTEILFVFDTLWTSQKLHHNDPLNIQRVMKHLRKHLLLALLTEPSVERVILALKTSVSVFDITAIDDPSYGIKSRKNPLKVETHFSFIDAIEDSYEHFINERNMELARIEQQRRKALRRRSSVGGKRKSHRSTSSTTSSAIGTDGTKPASSKSHRSPPRKHRKHATTTSSSTTDLPLHDPLADSSRLIHI